MKGYHVLGVHIRGTDKGTASGAPITMRIVKPSEYVKEIEKYFKRYPGCRLYVATDQQQYIDYMKEIYEDRIIYYLSVRSSTNKAPFQLDDGNNYKKGKDVLIESLLLSRCDFLMKCTSAVGEAALWFNPDLKSIDMNYIQ
jgi:hypothetical protein